MVTGANQLVTKLGYKVLSAGLNPDNARLKVGLWGTRSTGKTTSLAMLPIAAKASSWTAHPMDEATAEFLDSTHSALANEGRFPVPPADRPPVPYSVLFRRSRTYVEKVAGRRRTVEVTFLDASGNWCERPIPARASPDSPIDYLASCDAVLFFLDPARIRLEGSDFGAGVVALLDTLRRRLELPAGVRLRHRVAFVVPKIDEDELWVHRDRVHHYVMELVGMAPFHEIVDRFRPSYARFFACSSVGRVDGRSNCVSRDGASRIAAPARLEPFRLFEPLGWMLESVT